MTPAPMSDLARVDQSNVFWEVPRLIPAVGAPRQYLRGVGFHGQFGRRVHLDKKQRRARGGNSPSATQHLALGSFDIDLHKVWVDAVVRVYRVQGRSGHGLM